MLRNCEENDDAARKTEGLARGPTQHEESSSVPGRLHGRLSPQLHVLHLVERQVDDQRALPGRD
jgi:hypothetical protein